MPCLEFVDLGICAIVEHHDHHAVCAGRLYKGIFALRELAEEVVLEAIDEQDVVGGRRRLRMTRRRRADRVHLSQ